MKLLTDQEIFQDIDAQGEIVNDIRFVGTKSAGMAFREGVLDERARDMTIKVKTSYRSNDYQDLLRAEREADGWMRHEVREREANAFADCVRRVMTRDRRDVIKAFPEPRYHLHELSGDSGNISVELDCVEQIGKYKQPDVQKLHKAMEETRTKIKKRKNLHRSAALSVVNLAFTLPFALSLLPGYEHLYWAKTLGLSRECAIISTVLFVLAVLTHEAGTRSGYGFLNLFVAGGLSSAQFLYAPGVWEPQEQLEICGLVGLGSLIYCIRFVWRGLRAEKVKTPIKEYVDKVGLYTNYAHMELRFLALWYRKMTGKDCANLMEQERTLRKCIAYADKFR